MLRFDPEQYWSAMLFGTLLSSMRYADFSSL
jgi:hypothetical protein